MKSRSLAGAILAVIAILGLASDAVALAPGPLHIGGRFGLNLTRNSIDNLPDNIDNQSRIDFQLGGMAEYQVIPVFSIEGGLLYNRKGGKQELNDTETTTHLDYLSVPILGKFRFGMDATPLRPYLHFGPEISFLLSAKQKSEVNGDEGPEIDIKDNLKDLDAGVTVGAGTEFPIATMRGLLEIDYTVGLTDITDPPSGTTVSDTKNQTIYAVVGLIFF